MSMQPWKDPELKSMLERTTAIDADAYDFTVALTVRMSRERFVNLHPAQIRELIESQIKFKIKKFVEEFDIGEFEQGKGQW